MYGTGLVRGLAKVRVRELAMAFGAPLRRRRWEWQRGGKEVGAWAHMGDGDCWAEDERYQVAPFAGWGRRDGWRGRGGEVRELGG